MSHFQNRAISASAGTGKTFRLAHRYIGLMAAEVSPDRICALTFSRKAAGEIFDKIVERLCLAATDGKKRAETARTIAAEGLVVPPDQPEAYVRLLRQFLDHEHRLRIGTLDSFILGVVRAFPLELGIPPDTQPMDGDGGEAQARRQAILTRLFDPTRRTGNEGNREGGTFLNDFRLACFGRETKALASVLDTFIATHFGFYREHECPGQWQWGDPTRIWESAERWWEDPGILAAPIPADLPERFADAFGAETGAVKFGTICAEILRAASEHAPDRPWPKLSETTLNRLLLCVMQAEAPTVSYSRKEYTFPPDLWPPLRRALANLIGVEVKRALATTQGLHAVLDRYHRLYADELSRDGRFTFDDLSRLLGADGLNPGRTPLAPNRLYIDYRLDSRLDHWLLDEFQDTSDTQWAALANLIDEVVQGEDRSFFYVGDVKQSIYGWRGGNYRLFGQVRDQYRDLGPRAIKEESITTCHRSLPAVIETVNRIFDGLPGWTPERGEGKGPRTSAVADFAAVWQRHESARQGDGEGFAALLEYVPKKKHEPSAGTGPNSAGGDGQDAEGAGDPAEFEAVADILQEVWSAKLTTAVLVRSNAAGRACADVLCSRLRNVPVVHEGKGAIVDSPVVTLLLALVRYAAHPGDRLALRHLQMSPLATQPELASPDILPGALLKALHERGFAETLRDWGTRLDGLDPFGRQRLRELLAAAERFDATGVRDPDAFADYIQAYQVKASAAAGTVRVMTIHQAKGLGFGLVIVPFAANAKGFEKPGDPELLTDDESWVLEPPCQQALAAAAGAPLAALDAARAKGNFSQLCVLYVALTRAEQALYMIIPKAKGEPTTVREADLLRERLVAGDSAGIGPGRLEQLYASGDPAWFQRPGPGDQDKDKDNDDDNDNDNDKAEELPTCSAVRLTYAAEVARREPSKEHAEERAFPAPWLFSLEAGNVRAFGSAIHRLFERIEWLEDADIERLIAVWRAESVEPATLLADVERQFRTCLANPDVQRRLARPADPLAGEAPAEPPRPLAGEAPAEPPRPLAGEAPAEPPRPTGAAEVWREAPFNLVLESGGKRHLVSGRFDRLVLERNTAGRPVRATVFDFKSNRVDTEADMRNAAAGYAGQMADYARAAAHLLSLQPADVATVLLFTRTGQVWPR
jgi:ATP-dependent exoDNAse (exonuclease V) beta subunit